MNSMHAYIQAALTVYDKNADIQLECVSTFAWVCMCDRDCDFILLYCACIEH